MWWMTCQQTMTICSQKKSAATGAALIVFGKLKPGPNLSLII